jgi:hypothetical protein
MMLTTDNNFRSLRTHSKKISHEIFRGLFWSVLIGLTKNLDWLLTFLEPASNSNCIQFFGAVNAKIKRINNLNLLIFLNHNSRQNWSTISYLQKHANCHQDLSEAKRRVFDHLLNEG